jgi:hypothetical protein
MPSSAELLFQALDSKRITVIGETWQIGVYSIQEQAGHLWIQLGLNEATGAPVSLVVRAALTAQAEEILEGIGKWVARADRDLVRTITLD